MERELKEILSLAQDYWLALHCKGVWDQKEETENATVIIHSHNSIETVSLESFCSSGLSVPAP